MNVAATRSELLGDLLEAVAEGWLLPCGDDQDPLIGVLAEVDLDDPMSLRRGLRALRRWRLGGGA